MVDVELSLMTKTWLVFWRIFLRMFLGKEGRTKMLTQNPRINRVIRGWYLSLCSDGVLILPGDSQFMLREIYRDDVYGSSRIRKSDVAVDVGAHVGIFTLKAARKARLVIAVEPYPPNFKLLLANIRINRLVNVIPVNSALGSSNEEANLYISLKSDSHTISDRERTYTQKKISIAKKKLKVQLRTLDSLIEELGIDEVGYIKMDAEGAELDILKGATNALNNTGTRVAIACYHWPEEPREIRDLLTAFDFRIVESRGGVLQGFKSL